MWMLGSDLWGTGQLGWRWCIWPLRRSHEAGIQTTGEGAVASGVAGRPAPMMQFLQVLDNKTTNCIQELPQEGWLLLGWCDMVVWCSQEPQDTGRLPEADRREQAVLSPSAALPLVANPSREKLGTSGKVVYRAGSMLDVMKQSMVEQVWSWETVSTSLRPLASGFHFPSPTYS